MADERDPERLAEQMRIEYRTVTTWRRATLDELLDALVSLAKRAPQVEPPGEEALRKDIAAAGITNGGWSALEVARWICSQPWWPGRRG